MSALARIPLRRATSRHSLPPHPEPLSPALRRRIEDAIETLILLLDAADPDADLEPDEECEPEEDQDESEERYAA